MAVRAQIVLWLEGALLAAMVALIYAARQPRRGRRPWHCWGMAAAVAGQTLVSLWGMVGVLVRLGPSLLPTLDSAATRVLIGHALAGAACLALGWRVVAALQVRPSPRAKPWALRTRMRWTAVMWVLGFVSGVVLYGMWY